MKQNCVLEWLLGFITVQESKHNSLEQFQGGVACYDLYASRSNHGL